MKSKEGLSIAVASDIHLGHKRNETTHILQSLRQAFPDSAQTAKIDLLVFAGDVFDGLLQLPADTVAEIYEWIHEILRLCKKHDIVIRVLEGTPSHDWKQSRIFLGVNEAAHIHADLKYVEELSIEYIERFNINVLYVPDEWEDSTEKTLAQVKDLMRSRGLDQVDYAFMHGQFPHQLPDVVKAPRHDPDEYLKLVSKLIFIGHVHVFSTYERIIAQGSLDRLSHGEEGPKGHVRALVKSKDQYKITFVENKNARIFKTIDCYGLTLDETLAEIQEKTKDISDGSFVRISCKAGNPLLDEMGYLARMRPLITWSKLVREEQQLSEVQEEDDLSEIEFTPITITKENISRLLLERLQRQSTTAEQLELAGKILEEVK